MAGRYDDGPMVGGMVSSAPEKSARSGSWLVRRQSVQLRTQQIWLWTLLSDVELEAGRHVLSVLARKSGLRIDRIYLTIGDQLPPVDANWAPSLRR